jgi:FAD/FMN-containing dehydrogenase/Fe-S oxidoreductase
MSIASLPVVAQPQATTVDVTALQEALAQAMGGEVRFQRLDRALYATDASVYQIVPVGVVIPRSRDDVSAALRICTRFRVPITARGGGTSQAGQCIGPGVIFDFAKYLNKILEIQPDEGWARVEPGCVLDDLNQQARPHKLQFAPDISTANRATIGGMIANNSSGTHSLIHGKTIDHIMELTVLLADGSVVHMRPLSEDEWAAKCRQNDREGECYRAVQRLAETHAEEVDRRYPKILRRVGGYNLDRFVPSPPSYLPDGLGPTPRQFNLTHLLVGSEGTLGIVVEAKVRLVPLPRAKAVLVVQFADLLQALAATPAILKHQPAAVEVMDKYILDCTKLNPEASRLRDFLDGDPGAILIIEFYADLASDPRGSQSLTPRLELGDDLPARLDALEADLRRQGFGYHWHRATEDAAQARIWKLRTLALGLSMAEKGDAKAISFVEDTAVAPDHLRDYIDEFLQIIARHGTRAGVYAHASVGCLHVRPVINLKTELGVQRFQAIAEDVAGLVLKYGGALSGEHGDGLVRSPFQEKMFGPALYEAFREIKRTFDPDNLLNPGKIVDAPPLTANLRYGPAYVTPEVATVFDFTADGGLARAAELCAGVGECRKKRGGTMCPSYQATLEEQHSTRGRANTLRLALTGQLGLSGLNDPALREALDLCLECKACKSECPTNVDMARLKAEVLHQNFRATGLPWRNWLFGHVASLAKWGCRLAPVSNWLARGWLGRWLNEKLFGIDRRRRPPRFAFRSFAKRVKDWNPGAPPHGGKSVLLFPDTFMHYNEPEIGIAALEVLRRCGQHVVPGSLYAHTASNLGPGDLRCCGRPLISNGMLAEAIANARHNVAALYPWASAGNVIVACEPSCILTIKDDYPALLSGEERTQAGTIARACFTIEEILDQALAKASSATSFRPGPKRILVQSHCHQRSLTGTGPALRLLQRIPGAEVIDLDAGCCGMAGSFGYEREHYEISRQVGEQRLFPRVRQAIADDVIVASGFSCRMQIEHFTGRQAIHPATLLRNLIDV